MAVLIKFMKLDEDCTFGKARKFYVYEKCNKIGIDEHHQFDCRVKNKYDSNNDKKDQNFKEIPEKWLVIISVHYTIDEAVQTKEDETGVLLTVLITKSNNEMPELIEEVVEDSSEDDGDSRCAYKSYHEKNTTDDNNTSNSESDYTDNANANANANFNNTSNSESDYTDNANANANANFNTNATNATNTYANNATNATNVYVYSNTILNNNNFNAYNDSVTIEDNKGYDDDYNNNFDNVRLLVNFT